MIGFRSTASTLCIYRLYFVPVLPHVCWHTRKQKVSVVARKCTVPSFGIFNSSRQRLLIYLKPGTDSSDPLDPGPLFPPKCPAVAAVDSCFKGRTNLSCWGGVVQRGFAGFGGLYSLRPMTLHSLRHTEMCGVWKNADRLQI